MDLVLTLSFGLVTVEGDPLLGGVDSGVDLPSCDFPSYESAHSSAGQSGESGDYRTADVG